MIARIMQCDWCRQTAGARPARSGTEARKADHAGTIRRVRLGYAVRGARRTPRSRDLCATCRSGDVPAQIQQIMADAAARYAHTFEPVR